MKQITITAHTFAELNPQVQEHLITIEANKQKHGISGYLWDGTPIPDAFLAETTLSFTGGEQRE